LQNAAEKMARELLGMATDPNVSDSVKLAAIRDALDRAGLKPITTVDLEVSTKPWEQVFEGIAKVVAGPRDPEHPPALENSSLDATESENADEIVGEIDDDEIDDDLPRFQPHRESESDQIVDVEIVNPDGYTDEIMRDDGSGTATPDADDSSASEPYDPGFGPLGPTGPAGSGLMPLDAAIEAASVMRQREAARLRNARRR
jgi:hypothetical protein